MPNRIIKDTIRTSKKINSISDFEFRLWVYLITYVDDYGRGSADPELLKGLVFTRRKGVTEQQISKAIASLANVGIINLYEVDGESYLYFPNWDKHQRIRDCKPKFPAPPECSENRQSADDLGVLPQSAASCGELPPESESNPNPNPNPESKEANASCAEPKIASAPPAIILPLNDGTGYSVSVEQCHEWAGLYPAVDVIQQLRNMKGWLDANPKKRKTAHGILSFINRWLAKEQDSGRTNALTHKENGRYVLNDKVPSSFDLEEIRRMMDKNSGGDDG